MDSMDMAGLDSLLQNLEKLRRLSIQKLKAILKQLGNDRSPDAVRARKMIKVIIMDKKGRLNLKETMEDLHGRIERLSGTSGIRPLGKAKPDTRGVGGQDIRVHG